MSSVSATKASPAAPPNAIAAYLGTFNLLFNS